MQGITAQRVKNHQNLPHMPVVLVISVKLEVTMKQGVLLGTTNHTGSRVHVTFVLLAHIVKLLVSCLSMSSFSLSLCKNNFRETFIIYYFLCWIEYIFNLCFDYLFFLIKDLFIDQALFGKERRSNRLGRETYDGIFKDKTLRFIVRMWYCFLFEQLFFVIF